jgi:hypothetical protein
MPKGLALAECETEVAPVVTTTNLSISATVYEVGGTAPATIIRTNQDWYTIVEWEITGNLVHHLCGDWRVSVNLESIGPGGEYQFPSPAAIVPMDPCGTGKYQHRINVGAGQVRADEDGTLYILGVTLASKDPCGDPGHLAAHCSGDEIQFVQGPPHGP